MLDLDVDTGRLSEAWRVGRDVLEYRASCDQTADPAPASAAVEPSTRGHDDYTLYAIADGLPLPVPRRPYEVRIAPYRSVARLP